MPAFGTATPLPYAPMGRFSHEALAVDPATGIVYETEDAGNTSGFYRFLPNVPGQLAMGGPLEMLGIDGAPGYDTIETTLFSPWWFVGPGYEAYITVRNNTVSAGSDPGHPVRVLMYDQSGAICHGVARSD